MNSIIRKLSNQWITSRIYKQEIRSLSKTAEAMPLKSNAGQHSPSDNLVWVDLEMTGLDINKDTILEIACIITDAELNIVEEGPDIAIHHPESVLTNMQEWSQKHHQKSGLTEACRKSSVDLAAAEMIILDFVKKHVPKKQSPLCGNSVYMDKLFLIKYFPTFNEYLHYRIIDTSSIKELCKRWYPKVQENVPLKTFQHRALADIQESIEELKYYRCNMFK